jgi:hypothetical protein
MTSLTEKDFYELEFDLPGGEQPLLPAEEPKKTGCERDITESNYVTALPEDRDHTTETTHLETVPQLLVDFAALLRTQLALTASVLINR